MIVPARFGNPCLYTCWPIFGFRTIIAINPPPKVNRILDKKDFPRLSRIQLHCWYSLDSSSALEPMAEHYLFSYQSLNFRPSLTGSFSVFSSATSDAGAALDPTGASPGMQFPA